MKAVFVGREVVGLGVGGEWWWSGYNQHCCIDNGSRDSLYLKGVARRDEPTENHLILQLPSALQRLTATFS